MRFAFIGTILLFGVGCKAITGGPLGDSCGSDASSCKQDKTTCKPTCKHDDKCKDKDRGAPLPPTKEGPPPERGAAVTQDILLIPRMVYVPYAPQTPVGPARLGMAVPGRDDGGPREGPPPPEDKPKEGPPPAKTKEECNPCREAQLCDMLEKCCKKIEALNDRINKIEQRTQSVPCPPVVAPRPPLLPRNRQDCPTICEPICEPKCAPATILSR
jgi:hypothetical protein